MSKQRIWWLVGVVGVATAVALLPPGWLSQGLAFGLLWLVPIPVIVSALGGSRLKSALRTGEDWLVAAGLLLLIQPLVALIVHYLPGAIPTWLLLLTAVLLPLLLPPAALPPLASRPSLLFLLPILLALLLRLPNMGYKEVQGDEGVILVRAAAALLGDDAELFLHQKGPMEILLPLVTWGVTGEINEFWARLPFLWAGLLGVVAVMLLARRWFADLSFDGAVYPPLAPPRERGTGMTGASSPNGGGLRWGFTIVSMIPLTAGFLFAIMGFGIAFSRIIQYQALVMLWGMLALLTATRYGEERKGIDLVLTAVFLAAGLLAHYDAVLLLPAVAWLLLKGERRKVKGERRWGDWGMAAGVGLGILGLFYVPFALNPNFERTVGYLLNDRVGAGDGAAGWSGTAVWQMMTFYNSTYYIVGLVGLVLLGVWLLAKRREGGTAVLMFLVPALFYIFVVSDPRTHVYTIFPGAVILAAVGAVGLIERIRTTHFTRRATLLALSLIWFTVSANYVYLLFVDVTPERQRNWMAERPSLYPTTWTEPPLYGLFGFPHQAGWREVASILGDDFGPYGSNEEKEITNWYMKQSPRTHCANFDKFVWVANAQDEVPYDVAWLQNLQAEVVVNGAVALQVYGREVVNAVERVVVDEGNGRSPLYTPSQIAPATYSGTYPVDITFGEQVRLLGYDLDSSQAQPGGQLWVTLYWQPLVPLQRNYQVFTHLYDGQMRGQADGAPECDLNPTTRWEPGQIIADPHRIPIADDAPATAMPLLVGMYGLLDQQRLAVPNSPDNALHLTDVVVGE